MSEEPTEQIVEALRRVPLFSELSAEELASLAAITLRDQFRPGRQLYRQSDDDGVLYVLLSGKVALYHVDPQGVESFVGYREPGEEGWMGEAAVLLGEPRDVTAMAVEDTQVLEIERRALKSWLDATPGLREKLMPRQDTADKIRAPHFGWQAEDENVVIFIRKHPWALLRSLLVPAVVLTITLAAAAFFSQALPPLTGVFLALAILIPAPIVLFVAADWRNDFYVLTDRRLVHEENIPLIRRKREEAPLSAVQDVQFARNTLMANLLNYANLTVETFAGGVEMRDIPEPEKVKELIFREIERVGARTRATARKAIFDELRQRVGRQQAPVSPPVVPTPAPAPASDIRSFLTGIVRYFIPYSREIVGDSVIYRKHWIVLFRITRLPVGLMLAVLLAGVIWWNRGPVVGLLPDEAWWVWPGLVIALLAWTLWEFEDWRNDLYILTSTRVIDLERVPFLLQETRKEAGLDRIQTTEVDIPTLWARVLGYGDVIIRVAGASGEFRFVNVRDPTAVQTEVTKRVDQFKRRQTATEERRRRTELSDWFATYDEVKSGYRPPVSVPQPGEQAQDGNP